uniref:hypothetical protein n=1 Tax=Streptomyces tubercidicus TaxID=47759 RepID=UPI0030DE2A53|nr:hypothetical protein OG690_38415 [Streptomyces tubercidicus]
MTSKENLPQYVSFSDGAHLLVRRGLAGSMTPQGLRYIAQSRTKNWPFGEGRTEDGKARVPYLMAGKARLMETRVFIEYFEKHPPRGRGPSKKPRSSQ